MFFSFLKNHSGLTDFVFVTLEGWGRSVKYKGLFIKHKVSKKSLTLNPKFSDAASKVTDTPTCKHLDRSVFPPSSNWRQTSQAHPQVQYPTPQPWVLNVTTSLYSINTCSWHTELVVHCSFICVEGFMHGVVQRHSSASSLLLFPSLRKSSTTSPQLWLFNTQTSFRPKVRLL